MDGKSVHLVFWLKIWKEKKIKSFVKKKKKKNPTLSFILNFYFKIFQKNKNKNYEHFISDFSLFYHFSYVDLKKIER